MQKVLIVKTSSLGDIVHAFPVVDALRTQYPQIQIDWVIEASFAELVRAHPQIRRVLTIDTRRWRKRWWGLNTIKALYALRKELRTEAYDAIIDLQGNMKSGLVSFLAKGAVKVGFGIQSTSEWLNALVLDRRVNPPSGLNVRDEYLTVINEGLGVDISNCSGAVTLSVPIQDKAKVAGLLSHSALQHKMQVLVCHGSRWPNKQVTPETIRDFLERLHRQLNCGFLFVWGTPEERRDVENLQARFPKDSVLVERLSLSALQTLMAQVNLVVAMDSLPLHLAATTLTPTFSVFGASSALKYKPTGKQHHALQGACPYQRQFPRRCPILRSCPTGSCIRELSGEQLYNSFTAWWGR